MKFVIQEKEKPWVEKWKVSPDYPKFKTADEARLMIEKLPKLTQPLYRVAEEYTVIRYKAVKI